MVDTDPEPSRKDSYALMVDWPESDERPRRCAFIRSQSNPPPSLAASLDDDRDADQREELNALYVALTRAREQLVFSRTQPRGQVADSWWQRLAGSGAIDPEQVWQVVLPEPISAARVSAGEPVSRLALPTVAARSEGSLPIKTQVEMSSSQQLLGQVVHRVLEWLTPLPLGQRTLDRIERAVVAAGKSLQLEAGQHGAALHLVNTILSAPSLQAWLDPAQLAWAGNEVTLHHQGQVLRIDRLVAVDKDGGRQWWVLDYKLQHRPQALEAYKAQMAGYVAAVSSLQAGEPVRAAFITGAGEWIPLE